MTRVAITGHRDLDDPTARVVEEWLRATLSPYAADGLVGVSCLAAGADQIFARVVLELGGRLEAVVVDSPVPQPRTPVDLDGYAALLRRCAAVWRLSAPAADGAAHLRAGIAMLERADILVAVWDGLPGRGPGGTADTVGYAERLGMPVVVLWPDGARRGLPVPQARTGAHDALRPQR